MMQLRLRRAAERGHANHGWLDTYHSFSFAHYHDPDWMGYRNLRVLNQDTIQPHSGFGQHPHRDMEIVSYVLRGALRHRDSMGNEHVLRPGDVQRMTAGTGVVHAEMNADAGETEFLQIWIQPTHGSLEPGYAQRRFDLDQGLQVVASPNSEGGGITLNADATIHAGRLAAGQGAALDLAADRHAWIHVARGAAKLNNIPLGPGDGAALESGPLQIRATENAEILVFDLP